MKKIVLIFTMVLTLICSSAIAGPGGGGGHGGGHGGGQGHNQGFVPQKNLGPAIVPPGWSHGKKKGWKGAGSPPGLHK